MPSPPDKPKRRNTPKVAFEGEHKRRETPQEIHHLFHRLWTKAVGTKDYSKAEWRRMEAWVYHQRVVDE